MYAGRIPGIAIVAFTASINLPELITYSDPVLLSTDVTANGIFNSSNVFSPKYFFNNECNPPNPSKEGESSIFNVKSFE